MQTVRRLATAAAVAALALSTVAAEGDPTPPTLEVSGKVAGGVATVTGTAVAGEPGRESVNGLPTSWADPTLGGHAGIELVDAFIEPVEDGLQFTWKVTDLHAPAPPEVVRYTWSFLIGEASFQLQAKTSNIASSTLYDDPAGHVTHAGSSFQVRGNCEAEWLGTPVSNCPHIGWIDGEFDTANGEIRTTLPYDFHELVVPGAVIVEHQTAGMSIAASAQAVASNSATSSFINGWTKPYVAGLGVFLVAAPADVDPSKVRGGTPLEVGEDGSFTGSIELEAGEAAFVRACSGFLCVTEKI